jgi:SAM-dependent methyltransferase
MHNNLIQRQYDEVIAPYYDRDPQAILATSLSKALVQLREHGLGAGERSIKVLDIGMGTGRFLEQLIGLWDGRIQPYGLDLSERMVEVARSRLTNLVAAVDDAANVDDHFPGISFDLICTHFMTGFVPISTLAPKIWGRLSDGGLWSCAGGTKEGFANLQRKARSKALKWVFRGKKLDIDALVCNPADRAEVFQTMESVGFEILECETFRPAVRFANFKQFMEFAYFGGWLTPFIEALGLHKARRMTRILLNAFVFPVKDHHHIEIVLAQKGERI